MKKLLTFLIILGSALMVSGHGSGSNTTPAAKRMFKVDDSVSSIRKVTGDPERAVNDAVANTVSGNTLTFNPAIGFKSGKIVQPAATTATTPPVLAPNHFYVSSTLTVPGGPFALATGDIDGDGDVDMVSSSQSSNTVGVSLNDGTGNFSAGTAVVIGATTYYIPLWLVFSPYHDKAKISPFDGCTRDSNSLQQHV